MVRKFTVCIVYLLVSYFSANLMVSASVFAQDQLESNSYCISNFETIEDPIGRYSFDEISSEDYSNQYRAYPGKSLSLGITKSVYWIRFKLLPSHTGDISPGQLLQLDNPNIDKIDIYIPINNKNDIVKNSYIEKEVGVSRPSSNRDIIDNTWVFQLTNEFNDKKFIYLRLESTSALRLPVVVWNSKDFIAEMLLNNLGFGAFYGVLIAMLIFNLFTFSVLRDKTYLFYVLYIGFMLLYQFQVHGHFKMFIDLPYRLYNAIFWVWLAAAFICSVYFTRRFLQVTAEHSGFNRLLTGIVLVSVFQGVLGVLDYNILANQIAHGLGIMGPIFFMIIAVIRFKQGFRPARYYILAWGVLSIGIVMWSLSAYVSGKVAAVNYLLLATASESLLLSLALADRVKSLRLEGEALGKSVQWYRDLSFTDGLTGLYNKRFFDIKINEEITLALRWNQPMVVMVIDIDKFKSYNDTYGHWEGDQVIIRLSQILLQLMTQGQKAFRYGGDEFVILLPNCRCDDATSIAKQIHQAFKQEIFFPGMKSVVTVTISIGMTKMRFDDKQESLFQRADEALYKAKAKGRNQIVML